MADTELLYSTDAYLRIFLARVLELMPDGGVILDRTAFYPTGGGQPHDLGSLSWDGGSARVVEVRKDGNVRIAGSENKGKGNKRLVIVLE